MQALRDVGTNYVLTVKRNQSTLHTEVRAAFADAEQGTFTSEVQDHCETVESQRRPPRATHLHGPVGPAQPSITVVNNVVG